jgi:hypothetical protein
MADDPAFLIENYFSDIQFSTHVISANEEGAGTDAFRVATGRRSSLDRWSPTSLNAEAWIKVDLATSKSATACILDRGHNLAGETVVLERSANDSDWTQVFSVTIPATAATDGDFDDANGITTDEGAWVKRFSSVSDRYWRLRIPAMGADLKPDIVGVWLGNTWEPGKLTMPALDEHAQVITRRAQSDVGWEGNTKAVRQRAGELFLQLDDAAQAGALAAIEQFDLLRPMWILEDADRAERAVLARRPDGRAGFGFEPGWFPRQGRIPWVEHQPKVT